MHKQLISDCRQIAIEDIRHQIPKHSIGLVCTVNNQPIYIVGVPTNLNNGYRQFFLCPQCGNKHMKLYEYELSGLACRKCLDLDYSSSLKKDKEMV